MTIYICRLGIIHLEGDECKCETSRAKPQPYALAPELLNAPAGYHRVEVRTEQDGTQKLHKI